MGQSYLPDKSTKSTSETLAPKLMLLPCGWIMGSTFTWEAIEDLLLCDGRSDGIHCESFLV